MDELVGREIAGFRVEKKIGEGGMGAVYRAIQLRLKRDVALKILPGNLRDKNPTFVERFMREAQLAAQLSHPNIVQVYDVGEEDGTYYMAMEFVRGRNVGDILREHQQIPESDAVKIIHQAALALEAGMDIHLIHRDIKPENLMVTEKGITKVADFGLAKNLDADTLLTQSGQIMGTPAYMSPEQGQGEEEVDHRADIYSLGTTLYKMLTGQVPFSAGTPMGIIFKHINAPRPDPRDVDDTLSVDLSPIVMKMMASKTEERYQTYGELIADLTRLEIAEAEGMTLDLATVAAARPSDATDSRVPTGETIQTDEAEGDGRTLMSHTPVPKTPPPGSEPTINEPMPASEDTVHPIDVMEKTSHTLTMTQRSIVLPVALSVGAALVVVVVVMLLVLPSLTGKEESLPGPEGEGSGSGGTPGGGSGAGGTGGKKLELAIESPVDGSFINSAEVEVNGKITGSGLDRIVVNGREARVEKGSFSAVVMLGQGRVPITVIAYDKSGHRTTRELDVTVDTAPPVLAFGGEGVEKGVCTRESTFTINIRLQDKFPHRVLVNGEEAAFGGRTHRYEARLPEDGDHSFRVVGSDQAGNETEKTVRIRRDTKAPALTLPGFKETVESADPNLTIAVESSEELASLTVNGKPTGRKNRSFGVTITLKEGKNILELRAFDAAGNVGELDKTIRYKNPEATPEARERRAFEAIAGSEGDPFDVMEKLLDFTRSKPESPYAEKARKLAEELKRKDLPGGVFRSDRKGIYIHEKDGAELVKVPAGSFLFGVGAGVNVSCSPFFLYRTEVTNGRFAAFLASGGNPGKRVRPTGWVREGPAWVPRPGTEDFPVRGIPWTAAVAYAEWAGGELPSEAQWEYAARGSGGNVYPWGSESPDLTRARYNAKEPLACGSLVRGASPVGAQDMAGNVWEWCRDNFQKDPGFSAGARDPVFTSFSFGRVVKGGGYNSGADSLRAVNRTGLAPNSTHPWLGFRVVLPAR